MNKLISISILSLYLLFSLGLSFNIHECDNGNINIGFFTFLKDNSNCDAKKCCHSHHEQENKCNCEDEIVFLELTRDQISVSLSSFKLNSFLYNHYSLPYCLVELKNNSEKEVLANPPPLIPTYKRIYSTQQLLFYA